MAYNVFTTKDGESCYILDIADIDVLYDTNTFSAMWSKMEFDGVTDNDVGEVNEERRILQFGVNVNLVMVKGNEKCLAHTRDIVEKYLEDMHICHCRYDESKFEEKPELVSMSDFIEYEKEDDE